MKSEWSNSTDLLDSWYQAVQYSCQTVYSLVKFSKSCEFLFYIYTIFIIIVIIIWLFRLKFSPKWLIVF